MSFSASTRRKIAAPTPSTGSEFLAGRGAVPKSLLKRGR
jgi:hypothetical protein